MLTVFASFYYRMVHAMAYSTMQLWEEIVYVCCYIIFFVIFYLFSALFSSVSEF